MSPPSRLALTLWRLRWRYYRARLIWSLRRAERLTDQAQRWKRRMQQASARIEAGQ